MAGAPSKEGSGRAAAAGRAGAGGSGSSGPGTPVAPRANRLGRPSWLDPRLVVGILLIAVALVGGARVVGSAGHTTPVWSLRHSLGAGAVLTTADLVPASVHFAGAGDVDRYLPAGSALPAGARVSRSVGSGELLPRSAVSAGAAARVALPLAVASGDLPPGLVAGTVVDVWSVPDRTGLTGTTSAGSSGTAGTAGSTAAGGTPAAAVQLLSAVPVAAVAGSGALGTTGATVVTVSIPRDAAAVATVLRLAATGSIVVLAVSDQIDATDGAGATAPSGG